MNILILWAVVATIYFIYKGFKKHREKECSQELDEDTLQIEHVDKLFEERIIGNFILTKAAVPGINNIIKPIEGFTSFAIDDGQKYFKVVAALSAEKIFDFLINAIHLVGDFIDISIVDYGKDFDKVHEHFSFRKDTFLIENILSQHKPLIVNNGDIQCSFWSVENRFEMQLDRVKHFIFYTEDIATVERLFDHYSVRIMETPHFFPEGEYFTRNEFLRTPELLNLLDKLEIEDTKTYNAEADQNTV
jgi:hypothetical protein